MHKAFVAEASLAGKLNHPHIVEIVDAVVEPDHSYLVMEYVAGGTLREVVDEAPVEPARTLELLRPVAAALDHAHAHGIVHRDVKPSNVLLGKGGAVKLGDLGLATAAEITRITPPGSILGTPAYMAPEQAQPVPCTPATDIYALATIAFQLLSGTLPRTGSTAMAVLRQAASMPPPDLRERRPGTPEAAAETLKRGMALEPGERPPTAAALLDELAEGLGTADDGARRQPERTRVMRPAPRRRTPADVLAAERAPSPPPRPRRRSTARMLAPLALLTAAAAVAAVLLLTRDPAPEPRAAATATPAATVTVTGMGTRKPRTASPRASSSCSATVRRSSA
jgi:serine/threonine-protein kinase